MQSGLQFKIVLIGDETVGKSSIMEQFMFDKFNEKYQPTLGVDYFTKKFEVDNQKLGIYDMAGQIIFRPIISTHLRFSQAVIICYDITNKSSFQSLPMWIEMVKKELQEEVLIYILGNKIDLQNERKVKLEQAQQIAQTSNAQYFETSAKSGQNIKDVFQKLAKDLLENKIIVEE